MTKYSKGLGKRIKGIRGNQSQGDFALALKTIKQTISKYEKGKILPGCGFLRAVHTTMWININWLLTGEGSKYKYPESMMAKFRIWADNNSTKIFSEEEHYCLRLFIEGLGLEKTKSIIKRLNQEEEKQ